MSSLQAIGLDAERSALAVELLRLNTQVHDRAVGLVGLPIPPDLTMQQLRVLGVVAHEPGLTGQELGARLGVSAPTASGLIDRLVEKGVLERTDDAADRRRRRLRLTPEGVELLGGIDATMGRMFEAVIPPIPTEDLQAIKLGTEAMLRAIEAALANRPV